MLGFVVVVIRLVCAALAVDPFVQYGGAIYATSSTLTMTSCTLSGNTADVRTPATWMHDWLEWLMIVDVGSDDGFVVVEMGVGGKCRERESGGSGSIGVGGWRD